MGGTYGDGLLLLDEPGLADVRLQREVILRAYGGAFLRLYSYAYVEFRSPRGQFQVDAPIHAPSRVMRTALSTIGGRDAPQPAACGWRGRTRRTRRA